jgi:hypothetical protein
MKGSARGDTAHPISANSAAFSEDPFRALRFRFNDGGFPLTAGE